MSARMMPCSTPTAQTTTAVMTAVTNSSIRRLLILLRPWTSIRSIPMRNTIAPRVALGMSVSTLVKNSTTSSTITDMVRFATCVLPFWLSRIWVFVGLPFTTNVPVRPAARLAPPSPTMSRFTSTGSPCFIAKLREVAADCATMRIRQENAIRAIPANWADQSMPLGIPSGCGKPPDTAPTTVTPCAEASTTAEITMLSSTAMMAPGTLGRNRLNPIMITRVPSAKAKVSH